MEASGVLLLQEAMWSPFDAIMQPEHETTMAQVVLASSANVPDESGQSLRLPLVPWISDGALRSCNGLLENDNSSSSNVVHQESESDLIHMTSPFDDLASCLTSDDKSSNGIGDWIIDLSENVATDQWQTVKPKRKHLASKDDISSKCSNKARVSANVSVIIPTLLKVHLAFSSSQIQSQVTKTTDEELDASQDPNGRKRADKKPSAKSQSLYAKERRDRINKRLRILQNLVPNGSKVNISTMLEEAAHYVKFLQLQIKMLRSDELWMYAPIAYNGINVDLDLLWRNNNK